MTSWWERFSLWGTPEYLRHSRDLELSLATSLSDSGLPSFVDRRYSEPLLMTRVDGPIPVLVRLVPSLGTSPTGSAPWLPITFQDRAVVMPNRAFVRLVLRREAVVLISPDMSAEAELDTVVADDYEDWLVVSCWCAANSLLGAWAVDARAKREHPIFREISGGTYRGNWVTKQERYAEGLPFKGAGKTAFEVSLDRA